MIIDCHAHHIPYPYNTSYIEWVQRNRKTEYGPIYLWNDPAFENMELRLQKMQEYGIDRSVITYSANMVQILDAVSKEPYVQVQAVSDINFRAQKLMQTCAGKICACSWIDLRLGEEALAEMEKTSDWTVGYSVLAAYRINEKIRFLDDPVYEPFWKKAEELGRPVFIHFSNLYKINDPDCILPGFMNDTLLYAGMGQLMEDALCVARLILCGIFDRYPGLRIVMGQLGGMYPFMLERFEMLYGMYAAGAARKGLDVKNPYDASHFLRNLKDYTENVYADTHSMDPAAIRCACESMGEDRILFGSDYPITPDPWGMGRGIANIRDSVMEERVKQKILGENAKELLSLK